MLVHPCYDGGRNPRGQIAATLPAWRAPPTPEQRRKQEVAGSNARSRHRQDGIASNSADRGYRNCRSGDVPVVTAVLGTEPLLQRAGGRVSSRGSKC